MSMFTVTGQLMKVYKQEAAPNKETGEIEPPTWKAQILGDMPVRGGDTRLEISTLTVEDEKAYLALSGKKIRVALGFFAAAKGSVVMYIPKGSKPEVIA